ncbi:hypothetical protein N9J84_01535 [Porticoccaceae bacterium]|nr:hypothetical protein [Porticoccaceae bacterium]
MSVETQLAIIQRHRGSECPSAAGCSTLRIDLSFEIPSTINDAKNTQGVIDAMLTDFAKDYLKDSSVKIT